MNSLFSQYCEERLGELVIENDHGFVSVSAKNIFYIKDIFVKKEMRGRDIAHQLEAAAIAQAKALGYCEVFGSVSIVSKNPEFSLKMMLEHDYKLHSLNSEMIFLKKEI